MYKADVLFYEPTELLMDVTSLTSTPSYESNTEYRWGPSRIVLPSINIHTYIYVELKSEELPKTAMMLGKTSATHSGVLLTHICAQQSDLMRNFTTTNHSQFKLVCFGSKTASTVDDGTM